MEQECISWEAHCQSVTEVREAFANVLQSELDKFRTQQTINWNQQNPPTVFSQPVHKPKLLQDTDHRKEADAQQRSAIAQAKANAAAAAQMEAMRKDSETLQSLVDRNSETLRELRQQTTDLDGEIHGLRNEIAAKSKSRSKLSHNAPSTDLQDGASTTTGRSHLSLAQRKATLASFRKASTMLARSASIASANDLQIPSGKGGVEQVGAIPTLSSATAESYFSHERRLDWRNELSAVTPLTNSDLIQKMRQADNTETRLFEDTVSFMSIVQEQEATILEQQIAKQRARLAAVESHISSLVAVELQKLAAGNQSPVPRQPQENQDPSDTESSDSDTIESRGIELLRMGDGSMRICIGCQFSSNEAMSLEATNAAFENIAARELHMKESLNSMNKILRNLERCNTALENEIVCPSCQKTLIDLYLLWPCGHQLCLDCVYRNELPTGGYYCNECQATSFDIPVPNISLNDLLSRMVFKQSGVNALFDVINRFRKDIVSAETAQRGALAGLYIGSTV